MQRFNQRGAELLIYDPKVSAEKINEDLNKVTLSLKKKRWQMARYPIYL